VRINETKQFSGEGKVCGTADGKEFSQALNNSQQNGMKWVHSLSLYLIQQSGLELPA
jgi:hypothetical protein